MSADEQERASRDSLVTPRLAITHLADGVPLQNRKPQSRVGMRKVGDD